MRDPFTWSLPLGRLFGISIRLHVLFLVFALALWLRTTGKEWPSGSGLAMLVLLSLTLVAVLLHELGHCYAAVRVGGEAQEVLLWPLGGLAFCQVPHSPRAHFLTAAGGPLVNLLLAGGCAALLAVAGFRPNFDPRFEQVWVTELTRWDTGVTYGSQFSGLPPSQRLENWQVLVAQFFWINWFCFLVNTLLLGFPLDGGRMFQALLWPRLGYRQATLTAITAGFLVMLLVGIFALWQNEILILCLALYMWQACKQEWLLLETGSEDLPFGYDFSQGYTSLEREEAPPQPGFLARWRQRREAERRRREEERQREEERRMDQLLEKIQREGKEALTEEEQRFLKRVADRYRNRH
jgi:Zn-dependent protease